MKTLRYICMTIFIMVISSCMEEVSSPLQETREVVFSAFFADETKTVLMDGTDVYWLPGDQINVSGHTLTSTATEPVPFTDFEGIVPVNEKYYACYPQSMFNNWNYAPHVVMILPSTQKAVKGSFEDGLNAAVASTTADEMTFRFRNVLGYVKFTVPAGYEPLSSVLVETVNGEQLSGSFAADCSSDSPSGLRMPNATPFVQLVGDPLIGEGSYYMAMIPGTYEGGLKFTFKNKEGQIAVKTISNGLALSAGQIKNIGTISNLAFEDVASDPVPPDDEIWYISSDGSVVDPRTPTAFGANIVSNTYSNGKGVIKFDGEVTQIGEKAFWYCAKEKVLTNVYVPESVTEIGDFAFNGCSALTGFTIPSKVTRIGYSAFSSPWNGGIYSIYNKSRNIIEVGQGAFNSGNLSEFKGELVSEDGRCFVVDGKILAFAKAGLTEYAVPSGITEIGDNVFNDCNKLTKIVLPEGLLKIGESSFYQCNHMTEINIPDSVVEIGKSAFTFCVMLRSISFPDNLKALPDGACSSCQKLEYVRLGSSLQSIGEFAFDGCTALKSITIPESVYSIGDQFLANCPSLQEIKGKFASDDNRTLVVNKVLKAIAPYQLTEYTIPEGVEEIGKFVFTNYSNLTRVTIPEGVKKIGMHAFNGCGLLSLTLPSTLKYIENFMFCNNPRLTEVYCYAVTPPGLSGSWFNASIFEEGTIVRVPAESVEAYKAASIWNMYPIMDLDEKIYTSTDYTDDGTVEVIQKASVGNGIDVIFMGDAYSDRQIAAGDYDSDIKKAVEMLFAEEPYRTYRNLFNIYSVKAVSPTEGYGFGSTAFGGYFGEGTLVGGNHDKVITYAQKAISSNRMNDAIVIVMMNREYYAGTCYMFYPGGSSDFGGGLSISYFPLGTDDSMLSGLILHEAGGHGFAKLADEYSYEFMGTIPSSVAADHMNQQDNWGWWKNVDFTADPDQVRWAYFLDDERYADDGLGCFEGGLTYWSGVWRPTENSIMRYNTGGFNAPSREAIYYRIHKLAYGDSWESDYETFVKYDAVNRAAAAAGEPQKRRANYVEKDFVPTAPPIVIPHAWDE